MGKGEGNKWHNESPNSSARREDQSSSSRTMSSGGPADWAEMSSIEDFQLAKYMAGESWMRMSSGTLDEKIVHGKTTIKPPPVKPEPFEEKQSM
jgi:hypothetical protein